MWFSHLHDTDSIRSPFGYHWLKFIDKILKVLKFKIEQHSFVVKCLHSDEGPIIDQSSESSY